MNKKYISLLVVAVNMLIMTPAFSDNENSLYNVPQPMVFTPAQMQPMPSTSPPSTNPNNPADNNPPSPTQNPEATSTTPAPNAGQEPSALTTVDPTELFSKIDSCPSMLTTQEGTDTITFFGIDSHNNCQFMINTPTETITCQIPEADYLQYYATATQQQGENPENENTDESSTISGRLIFNDFMNYPQISNNCSEQLIIPEVLPVKKPPNHFWRVGS